MLKSTIEIVIPAEAGSQSVDDERRTTSTGSHDHIPLWHWLGLERSPASRQYGRSLALVLLFADWTNLPAHPKSVELAV